jgi:hypothetical protein
MRDINSRFQFEVHFACVGGAKERIWRTTIFERYLADPTLSFAQDDRKIYASIVTSEGSTLEHFGQFINTYWTCFNSGDAVTRGINNDTTYF